jgi:hypothetical protein
VARRGVGFSFSSPFDGRLVSTCGFLMAITGVVFCSVLSSPKAGSGLVGSLLVSLLVFELELFSLDMEGGDFKGLDADLGFGDAAA